MAIAAFVISVLALLASGGSVWYARTQSVHAGTVAEIETHRSHVERTPTVIAQPAYEHDDDSNQHLAPVDVRNTTSFALHRVTISAIADRMDKRAIINVAEESRYIDVIPPGDSTRINVWLAYAGERSETGLLRFIVHDKSGDRWTLEVEIEFPYSITNSVW